MKVRTKFVSNSSSSSFCIVGCEVNDKICQTLGIDIGDDYEGHGKYRFIDGLLSMYGDGYSYAVVGFNAEGYLRDKTLNEAKQDFVKYMKEKYKVSVHDVELLYGEVGN